ENALTAPGAAGRQRIESRSIDPSPPMDVQVTDPDGKTEAVHLTAEQAGRATATRPALTPGVWRVTQGNRSAYAAAGAANPREIADVRVTAPLAAQLVPAGAGGPPELRGSEEGRPTPGSAWIGLDRRHDHVVAAVAALELLPSWISLPL